MHHAMELLPSSCGPCSNHAIASLLESAHRRPSHFLGIAPRNKCRSRLFAVERDRDSSPSAPTWKPQPHFFPSPPADTISPSPTIRSNNNRKHHHTTSTGSKLACAASSPGESSDEKENKNSSDMASNSTDWRAFRARLIANERASEEQEEQEEVEEQPSTSKSENPKPKSSKSPLATRWAHPILKPEAGCVLIATDKLDELSIFERTVIILLSAGSSKKNEGPFGLILNRPLPHVLKEIRPQDQALAEAFGESQVHFGGPLVSDLILLLQAASARKGYQEVVPGIFYSSAEGLEQAVSMIKDKGSSADDFRFFFGYAGWATGQLEREVEDGYWCVAACSTNLFISSSSINLWEEVLKLMGGQYAELSKKPKKRWFK